MGNMEGHLGDTKTFDLTSIQGLWVVYKEDLVFTVIRIVLVLSFLYFQIDVENLCLPFKMSLFVFGFSCDTTYIKFIHCVVIYVGLFRRDNSPFLWLTPW